MKKELKDYLHLYLGCKIQWGVQKSDSYGTIILHGENLAKAINLKWTPILRPLSDMMDDEYDELSELILDDIIWSPANIYSLLAQMSEKLTLKRVVDLTTYLLSKHFDLFGLIPSGLAIDKTTLKENA